MYIRSVTSTLLRASQLLVQRDFANDQHPTRNIDYGASKLMVQQTTPKVLGCCLLDSNGYVAYLVVHENYRGRGIGSRLFKAASRGRAVTLTCDDALVPFYERLGCTRADRAADGRQNMRKPC
jgi:ribosomal protein S18 acetylase RimI-like enzyme